MLIQVPVGSAQAGTPGRLLRVVLLSLPLSLSLCLGACSGTPQSREAANLSALAPADLLSVYLATEPPAETVRFRFSSEVETEAGKIRRLEGVCGYASCASLRLQLLGALGVTLLDYINAEGAARLVINQLTEEGDDPARDGLLQLMEILTLALVDRCHSADEFSLERYDELSADFSVPAAAGARLVFTLDRRSGRLLRQTVSGDGLPSARIDYSDYLLVDGHWLPGRLEIRTADLPSSIDLVVDRWSLGKPLPAGFFEAN